MIRYDLTCDKGHEFDGWFSDSESYDVQAQRGLVECAHCGSQRVEKQIMAPRISAKSNTRTDIMAQRQGHTHAQVQLLAQPVANVPADPRMVAMMQMMREIRKHVEKTAENVGDKFADEARKQHYNEAERRGIYGHATPDDARALLEEGIEVMPLPQLPEDTN
jgi:hypothetical protein